ncbi:MAG: hypothetical protein IPO12_08595 [Flavobacteriales bacterium]|nr:hypothetical protein [Flavobacteriales bacterium]MBK9538784.1 hypothetical protein [Flavobacteriales bacterium]
MTTWPLAGAVKLNQTSVFGAEPQVGAGSAPEAVEPALVKFSIVQVESTGNGIAVGQLSLVIGGGGRLHVMLKGAHPPVCAQAFKKVHRSTRTRNWPV